MVHSRGWRYPPTPTPHTSNTNQRTTTHNPPSSQRVRRPRRRPRPAPEAHRPPRAPAGPDIEPIKALPAVTADPGPATAPPPKPMTLAPLPQKPAPCAWCCGSRSMPLPTPPARYVLLQLPAVLMALVWRAWTHGSARRRRRQRGLDRSHPARGPDCPPTPNHELPPPPLQPRRPTTATPLSTPNREGLYKLCHCRSIVLVRRTGQMIDASMGAAERPNRPKSFKHHQTPVDRIPRQ